MLQDSHAHFQAVNDKPGMREVIMALEAGRIGRVFCNGTSRGDWGVLFEQSCGSKEITAFYGIHPWFSGSAGDGWEKELVGYLEKSPSSGVGEIGMDRARIGLAVSAQADIFEKQLDIAFGMKRPFTVHGVDAWGDIIRAIKKRAAGKLPFIAHSFSGSAEVMDELIGLGGYISFSLRILEKRYTRIARAFAMVPLERMLLETDFPYAPGSLSKAPAIPSDYFGCVNRLYEAAARIRAVEPEKLEKAVWDNGTVFMP